MVWHRENAVNAYLDSVKLCKEMKSTCSMKKIEPESTELISALAGGMNAEVIVEVCSKASLSTIGLAAAARQTGGRYICILDSGEPQTQTKIQKALNKLGLESTTEFVTGDAKKILPKYRNVDFALIDCKIKDYPEVLKVLNVNPTRAVVVTNNLSDGKFTAPWEKKVGVKSTTLPIGKGIQVTKFGNIIDESSEAPFRSAGIDGIVPKSCDCNGKSGRSEKRSSKWIVQVDERTGEEHVFRVFTHRSKPTQRSISL